MEEGEREESLVVDYNHPEWDRHGLRPLIRLPLLREHVTFGDAMFGGSLASVCDVFGFGDRVMRCIVGKKKKQGWNRGWRERTRWGYFLVCEGKSKKDKQINSGEEIGRIYMYINRRQINWSTEEIDYNDCVWKMNDCMWSYVMKVV